jgi:hypothetical protein
MPGAYAHITLINLAREPARLNAGPGLPDGSNAVSSGRRVPITPIWLLAHKARPPGPI